jgi:hypothetical protein
MIADRAGRRFLIRGGASVIAETNVEPHPPRDYVSGQRCAALDQRVEISLLTCWTPNLDATAQRTPPTLELGLASGVSEVVARIPPGQVVGHWLSGYLSPDRQWIAATWSGECEAMTSWLISTSDGSQPSAVWPTLSSGALGWTPDSRAIFVLAAEPGCGTGGSGPGIYALQPGQPPVQLIATQAGDSATVLWGPERPTTR